MDFIYFLIFWGLLATITGIWAIIKTNQLAHEEENNS
jgi:hypothetical protein